MELTKICKRCGRVIEWRRKWKNEWANVQYCSDACRRAKITHTDEALERSIMRLLNESAKGATICPSEAARAVFTQHWQEQMEATRQAARRLVALGWIEITQAGHVVDPSTAKGAIRLRRGREFPSL